MYNIQRENTDNQCHTLSRFKCYLNPITEEKMKLELKTTKAHLFYKAVPCAYKVLFSNWLSTHSFTLVIVIIFYL